MRKHPFFTVFFFTGLKGKGGGDACGRRGWDVFGQVRDVGMQGG